MSSFKDYMNKEKNNTIIHDGHYHVEKMGGRTGPPIRVKTDDDRTTHIHKQSDDKDTVEARDSKRIPDDMEGSGTSLPENGYHDHMQTDGQFTSLQILPPAEGEEVGVGGISEKVEAVLNEGKVKKFKKVTPFSNSNLYMAGAGMDTNGNHVVSIKFPNSSAFTIQTAGNLNTAHDALRGVKDYETEIDDSDKKKIEKEIIDYVEEYGSKAQKSKLKKY